MRGSLFSYVDVEARISRRHPAHDPADVNEVLVSLDRDFAKL